MKYLSIKLFTLNNTLNNVAVYVIKYQPVKYFSQMDTRVVQLVKTNIQYFPYYLPPGGGGGGGNTLQTGGRQII